MNNRYKTNDQMMWGNIDYGLDGVELTVVVVAPQDMAVSNSVYTQ